MERGGFQTRESRLGWKRLECVGLISSGYMPTGSASELESDIIMVETVVGTLLIMVDV